MTHVGYEQMRAFFGPTYLCGTPIDISGRGCATSKDRKYIAIDVHSIRVGLDINGFNSNYSTWVELFNDYSSGTRLHSPHVHLLMLLRMLHRVCLYIDGMSPEATTTNRLPAERTKDLIGVGYRRRTLGFSSPWAEYLSIYTK